MQNWSILLQSIGLFNARCLFNARYLKSNTKDEHGSGLDRAGSGLKPILAKSGLDRTAIFLKISGSGLDRTEKIFVVLM